MQRGDVKPVDPQSPPRRGTPEDLVATARRFLGVPYLWGGMTVHGIDCSGFVSQVYHANGVVLPRDADLQFEDPTAAAVERSALQPGDLVFFGKDAKHISHVGMSVGGRALHQRDDLRDADVREDDARRPPLVVDLPGSAATALSLLALLFAAVTAAGPRTLVVGTLADPAALEPHLATDVVGAEIVANVCETLVRIRPGSLQAEGVLATTWATRDQRIWTFTLREGVAFHDGTPFDADAVVANFEHLRRERSFPGRAERVGPHVVQVVLDRANTALLPTLSQPFFSLQSPRRLRDPAPGPVGTGPFRVESVRPGRVELVAHVGYWGGAPRLERVRFRRFATPRHSRRRSPTARRT